MLAKKYRFHGYRSLNLALARGQVVKSDHLRIKYIRNPRRQRVRWAVVVSRKVDKRAVVRNRIRRRLYEIIRRQWPDFEQGLDAVVLVSDKEIAAASAAELEEVVKSMLYKICQKA